MGALTTDYMVPTDLYYACLDGSWDRNGNNVFGEPTDGETGGEVDLLGEVYVGRAPVDTVAEVNIFVEKTVRYETQPHPRSTNALFMAEYLGPATIGAAQGWDMFVPMLPFFSKYQVSALDDRPFTVPQWTTAGAINALNASPHLALFNGHGAPDEMMRMFSTDVYTLTNRWPFLAYSVGCDAGAFDNDKFSPDCFGEELVKHDSHGAFAAILNSRLGWYDPDNEWRWSGEFQTEFFRELLVNDHTRLGVAQQLGKQAMISHVESGGLMTYRYCYFEITLFGDPHLPWQTPPAPLRLMVQLERADPAGAGAARVLQWPSVAGRWYSVDRASSPIGPFARLTNGLPATPPRNTFTDSAAGPAWFYRLGVTNSP
jgi:hypothetical protein